MRARQYLVKETEKKDPKVIYLRCDESIYNEVHENAADCGVSTNSFVTTAIKYFLETLNKEKVR